MMQPLSRHVHPDQPTFNGSMYNDNYSIPHSKKVWALRNAIWQWRYCMAVWRNQFCESFAQIGSNMVEWLHRLLEQLFDHLLKENVGYKRLPSIALIQKYAHNLKRLQLILYDRRQEALSFDHEMVPIFEEMYRDMDGISGLDSLRRDYMDSDTGHGVLNFKMSNNITDYLHGFVWQNSISRVTRPTFADKQKIWQYIEQYQQQLLINNGSITDTKSLEFLREKLRYKMSLDKIKDVIYKYWTFDDAYLSDDFEVMGDDDINDLIGIDTEFDITPLSSQKKKHSEYVHAVVFINKLND